MRFRLLFSSHQKFSHLKAFSVRLDMCADHDRFPGMAILRNLGKENVHPLHLSASDRVRQG